MVDFWSPDFCATIVPAMPDESTCVVLTGKPSQPERPMVVMATTSAEAPWAYVRCVLPIFSPTVTTMRFQPIIVPRPSDVATRMRTHGGA